MTTFVHESSYVDSGARIGDGTKIWHFCHVLSGAVIGERCSFGQNCSVAGDVTIGNDVKVQNNVSIYDGTVIEDDVFLGPSCVLTNVTNARGHRLPEPVGGEPQVLVCPESGLRYQEISPGVLRCLDLDEEAALPAAGVAEG